MSESEHDEVTISVANREQWTPALELAFARLDTENRQTRVHETIELAESGKQSLDGLFIAAQGTRIIATLWATRSPGRTALISPPGIQNSVAESAIDQLFIRVNEWLGEHRVGIGQAILQENDAADEARFDRHGFHYVTDLRYMYSPPNRFPTRQPETSLALGPYSETDSQKLIDVIERTYVETLDCPALNGKRPWEDVLEGYRKTGDSGTEFWWMVTCEDRPAGCLLMTEHASFGQMELIYMGIVPEFRGRDFGRQLVSLGLWQASQRDQRGVVLAVDVKNEPAVRIYEQVGFQPWDRRRLLLRLVETEAWEMG